MKIINPLPPSLRAFNVAITEKLLISQGKHVDSNDSYFDLISRGPLSISLYKSQSH
jgi:hypothetical protein